MSVVPEKPGGWGEDAHLEPEEPTQPKYDVAVVEAVILEVAVELQPERLTTGGLVRNVVGDPDDRGEVDTGIQAVLNLLEVGLLTRRGDERVEPTPAGVRAVKLLT